jgi:hypothetical protein
MKIVWQFLKKLKIELLYDPTIPLLGLYPKIAIRILKRDLLLYSEYSPN